MRDEDNRPAAESADTASYFAAVREHRVLVALVLLIAIGAAVATAAMSKQRYEAETVVLVTPVTDDNAQLTGLGLLKDPAGAVFTAAGLVDTPQITREVIRRLKLDITQRDLLAKIKVTPLPQGNSFSILAKGASAKEAALLANTLSQVLIDDRTNAFQRRLRDTISRLDRQRADLRGTDSKLVARDLETRVGYLRGFLGDKDPTLEVLTRAEDPELPVARSNLLIVVSFLAALLLGTGVAILLEALNPRIRGEYDLPARVPLLARIPFVPERIARRFFSGRGPLPRGAFEPYRMLRARLTGSGPHGALPRSILVTSAISDEGRTRTAAGLATAIAASGRHVVLVEADRRGSSVTSLFGLAAAGPGLAAMLEGEHVQLDEALLPAGDRWPSLRILPAGADPGRGIDLVDPSRVEGVLAELSREADVIVVDSPPITEFADAVVLANAADVVLLAVKLGRSRQDRLTEAQGILGRAGAPAAGLVLTRRRGLLPVLAISGADAAGTAPRRKKARVTAGS